MTMPGPAALARATWRKSSYSGGGNQCVEVADLGATIAVRDSKNPSAGHLAFGTGDWQAFLEDAKRGRFGL